MYCTFHQIRRVGNPCLSSLHNARKAGSDYRCPSRLLFLFNRASTSIRKLCGTDCPSLVGHDTCGPCDLPSVWDTVDDCWTSWIECAAQNGARSLASRSPPWYTLYSAHSCSAEWGTEDDPYAWHAANAGIDDQTGVRSHFPLQWIPKSRRSACLTLALS